MLDHSTDECLDAYRCINAAFLSDEISNSTSRSRREICSEMSSKHYARNVLTSV